MFRYIFSVFIVLFLFQLSAKGQCPISISPNTPACAGTQIDFTTPINPDTSVVYTWDLGFGPPQNGPTASISYPNNNAQTIYTITLTVTTNTDTCVSVDSVTVLYTPDIYICGILDNCFHPQTWTCSQLKPVTLSLCDANGGTTNLPAGPYIWNFDDGNGPVTTSALSSTINYAVGTYNVSVTTTNMPCPVTVTEDVNYYTAPEEPSVLIPATPCEGDTITAFITFNDSICPGNAEYYEVYWDWPNLTPVDYVYGDTALEHIYSYDPAPNVPVYNTQFAIFPINPCFNASINTNPSYIITGVQVYIAPHPDFIYVPDPACWPDDSVITFINQTEPQFIQQFAYYTWYFGDPPSGVNDTSHLFSPTHTYPGPGTYNVTLTADDTLGCGARSITKPVIIHELPEALFTMPTDSCIPFAFTPDNLSTPDTGVTYVWTSVPNNGINFSDPTLFEPVVTIGQPGIYIINLDVESPYCGTDSYSDTIEVFGPPTINLVPMPDSCDSDSITYLLQSTVNGNGLTYTCAWDFGPNASPANSTSCANPTVTFATGFTHTVTLTTTNLCGPTSSQISFTIFNQQNISGGADSTLCVGGPLYCLTPNQVGGVWDFNGVLDSAFCFNPATVGSYQVFYIYEEPNSGCILEDTVFLEVAPLPTVTVNDFSVCYLESISLNIAIPNPTGGTWSGSPFIVGDSVYVADSLFIDSLTYTFVDSNGCEQADLAIVTVVDTPTVEPDSVWEICTVDDTLSIPTPAGQGAPNGVWSGPGVISPDGFNSSLVGIGSVYIYLDYTDPITTCSNRDSMLVVISAPDPAIGGGDLTMCRNDSIVMLPSAGNGIWTSSSPGFIPSNQFNPLIANSGANLLFYTINGNNSCADTDTVVYTVNDTLAIDAGTPLTVCEDAVPFNLTPATGGTNCIWTGPGITDPVNGTFDPSGITPGTTVTVCYQCTDPANSCVSTDCRDIFVKELPMIVFMPDSITFCQTPNPQQLVSTPSGGTWFGPGIISPTGIFDPTAPGINPNTTYTVFYEVTDPDGCYNIDSMRVRVEVPQVVTAPASDTLCENSGPITLTGFSPPGGTLTGNGVTGGLNYDPAQAGVGVDTLIYCDGTPGTTCFVCDTTTILVEAPPLLTAIPDTMCANAGPISLMDNSLAYGNIVVGMWTGPGVFQDGMGNYWFDTTTAGVYTVCFTYIDNDSTQGCSDQACMDILVNAIPIITFANDSVNFCQTPVLQPLSASPPGGIWSGPGVNSTGIFDPTDPAIIPNQVYTIYYSIANADSCNNIDSMVVRVDTPAVVIAPLPDTVCQNEGVFAFSGYAPLGGTFSGPGVNGTNFDPGAAGPAGLKTIIYCYGDSATSCQVCDTTTILLESPPPLIALPDSMCANTGPISLMDNALAYGMVVQGIWSGSGVFQDSLGNYWFDTNTAGIYTVCFTYVDNDSTQGCSDQACMDIEVYPVPVADFPSPANSCIGDSIQFVNNSTGASSYLWSFGDPANSTSSLANPVFVYNTIGTFVITLDVFSGDGCQDSRTDSIFISEPPIADFSLTADSCASRDILPGLDGVVASIQNNSYTAGGTYFWDFGGGFDSLGNLTSTDSIIPNLYFPQNNNASITYYITLTLSNYCDTLTHTDSVIVHPLPIADFYPNVDTFCSPFVPTWINVSSGDPSGYFWYGDTTFTNLISTDSVPNPMALTYTGTADTTYYFSLIAENDCGRDTGYYEVVVLPNTVTAFLNVSNTQGCSPLTIDFIGLANAPNTSVDFGDSTGVFNQDTISHTYTEPGTYLIQYFADNTCSYDTGTVVITVFPSPEINIQPKDTIVCPDQPITFFDSLGSANKTGYLWSFGDSVGTSTQISPTYVYTNPGIYTVSVSVQSTVNGCVSTDSTTIEVRPRPTADFLASSYQVCVGENLNFTNLSTGANNYFWSFGDTNTSTVFAPNHTYLQPNTYFVTLTVFDSLGCADVDSATVLVNPNPVADFSFVQSDSCGVPVNVQFTNLSTGNPTGYFWNFDPDTSTLNSPLHTFNLPGTYEITLIASTAFGCQDSAKDSVIIYPQPAPAWDIIPSQGCGPLEVTFINLSPDSSFTQANIRFFSGGALTPIVDSAIFTYLASSGNTSYFPELYLDYDGKCFDSISAQVDVFSIPDANFRVLNDSMCGGPAVVNFEDLSTDFNSVATWLWDFGDPSSGNQNISNQQSPSHRYENPGVYSVRLIVENPSGCRDTLTRNVTVFPQPQAAIQPDTAIGCYELLVNFTTSDTLSANAWTWDFGDGVTAFGSAVSHRYLVEGDYTVRLVSTYNQVCFDTAFTTIRVGIPPQAEFTAALEDQCDLEALLLTTNTSRNATRYQWIFGPFGNSTEFEPQVHFSYPDTFDILLIAENEYGCRDTAITEFKDPRVIAAFELDSADHRGCAPHEVVFINRSQGATSWFWDFGDGSPPVFDANPVHTFNLPGEYQVTLTVSNQSGCQETFVYPTTIQVFDAPEVDFAYQRLPGNRGLFQFTDQSPVRGDTVFWDLGDGTYSSELSFLHEYTFNPSLLCPCDPLDSIPTDSSFTVRLVHINQNGCRAEKVERVHPNIYGLKMPNALMISGEAVNPADTLFMPRAVGLCKLSLEILDGYGNIVWDWDSNREEDRLDGNGSPGEDEGWDGRINGVFVSRNVYVWRIREAEFTGCTPYLGPRQGTVTIVR